MHSDRACWPSHPAINVKVWSFGSGLDLVKQFNCSEEQSEHALAYAWNLARNRFWEDAYEIVQEIFPGSKMYQEGRSGGWLTVHGLPDVNKWDAVTFAKWSSLQKRIKMLLADVCQNELILDDIEANKWYLEGAEEFNFIDLADGKVVCLAEMRQEAIAAGFGPVVR